MPPSLAGFRLLRLLPCCFVHVPCAALLLALSMPVLASDLIVDRWIPPISILMHRLAMI